MDLRPHACMRESLCVYACVHAHESVGVLLCPLWVGREAALLAWVCVFIALLTASLLALLGFVRAEQQPHLDGNDNVTHVATREVEGKATFFSVIVVVTLHYLLHGFSPQMESSLLPDWYKQVQTLALEPVSEWSVLLVKGIEI